MIVLLLLIGYPLSIGPAYSLMVHGWLPSEVYSVVYGPLLWCAKQSRELYSAMEWYAFLFLPRDLPRR